MLLKCLLIAFSYKVVRKIVILWCNLHQVNKFDILQSVAEPLNDQGGWTPQNF